MSSNAPNPPPSPPGAFHNTTPCQRTRMHLRRAQFGQVGSLRPSNVPRPPASWPAVGPPVTMWQILRRALFDIQLDDAGLFFCRVLCFSFFFKRSRGPALSFGNCINNILVSYVTWTPPPIQKGGQSVDCLHGIASLCFVRSLHSLCYNVNAYHSAVLSCFPPLPASNQCRQEGTY